MAVSYHNTAVLASIRSRKKPVKKPEFSGFNFEVRRCKGGFGVYISSLSGSALKELSGHIIGYSETETHVFVISGRLARKSTKQAAEHYIERLKAAPFDYLISIAHKVKLTAYDRERNFKAVKLQYKQVRTFDNTGKVNHKRSSFDVDGIEQQAYYMQKSGFSTGVKDTISRTKVVPLDQSLKGAKVLPAIPQGITGMCKPFTQQTAEYSRRINQKKARTSSVSFWANKK